jgi:hypothetical protein
MHQSSLNEKGFTAGKKNPGKLLSARKKSGKYFSRHEKNSHFFEKSGHALPHKTKSFTTTQKPGQILPKSQILRRDRKGGQ